jgi:hypothetical protein
MSRCRSVESTPRRERTDLRSAGRPRGSDRPQQDAHCVSFGCTCGVILAAEGRPISGDGTRSLRRDSRHRMVTRGILHRSEGWVKSNPQVWAWFKSRLQLGVPAVDARRATPPDPRPGRRGLAGCCQLDPRHPALVTCAGSDFEPCANLQVYPACRAAGEWRRESL